MINRNGVKRVSVAVVLASAFGMAPGLPAAAQTPPVQVYLPVIGNINNLRAPSIFGTDARPLGTAGGLDALDSTRARWLRRNGLLWTWIEGNYEGERLWENDDFYAFEQELIEASRRGYSTIVVIRRTPEWASHDKLAGGTYKPCGRVHDSKLQAFGNFVHDAVALLSQPPYNVKHWEIWNEPDVDPKYFTGSQPPYDEEYGCYGDENELFGYGGAEFAKLLAAAYPRIKQADPFAKVYVGGLLLSCDPAVRDDAYCRASRFMRGVLAAGGAAHFDGISYHGYDYYWHEPGRFGNADWATAWNTGGVTALAKTRYLRTLLDEYGVAGKSLIFSEGALLCWSDGFCPQALRDENYEVSKAWHVPQLYAQSMAEGLDVVIWHSLKENQPPLAPDGRQFGTGLLDFDNQPKFAYEAYRYAADTLTGASFVRQVTDFPNARVYEFQRPNSRFWIAWSLTDVEQVIPLPSMPSSVTKFFYPPFTPTLTATLDANPAYIVWDTPQS